MKQQTFKTKFKPDKRKSEDRCLEYTITDKFDHIIYQSTTEENENFKIKKKVIY